MDQEIKQAIAEGKILWEQAVITQNDIINTEGSILRDDKRIWDSYLHTWNNDDWLKILLALKDADREHSLYQTELDHIHKIQKILIDYYDMYPRVLDKRDRQMNNKSLAWKMIMIMREAWNRIHQIEIKNQARISKKTDSVKNLYMYHAIFEEKR